MCSLYQSRSLLSRQVVEIRLVFLLLIRFKNAVAELHQISDLVVAELVPQHEIFDFVEAEMLGVSADGQR